MSNRKICKHCNKVSQPKYPHYRCNLCAYCPRHHTTEDHKCSICGANSHSQTACPFKARLVAS